MLTTTIPKPGSHTLAAAYAGNSTMAASVASTMVSWVVELTLAWTRRRGDCVFASGHIALGSDGAPSGAFGRVPTEVSLESAQAAAQGSALAMLASLKRELGDLERVRAWLMVHGMVNAEPSYARATNVVNACSDLILQLYAAEAGQHARVAVGMTALPVNAAVTIAAEVEVVPRPFPRTRATSSASGRLCATRSGALYLPSRVGR